MSINRLLSHMCALWLAATLAGAPHAVTPAPSELCRFAPTSDYLVRGRYLVAYDGSRRTTRWALELLDRSALAGTASRAGKTFQTDPEIPDEFAALPGDYDKSGFDQGHVTAAANHTSSADDLAATFTMANVMPQRPELNRGCWKVLETDVRSLATRADVKRIWVLTAPAWLSDRQDVSARGATVSRLRVKMIGKREVWVPTHCVKSVLIEAQDGTFSMQSWLIPNRDDVRPSPQAYRCSADTIERAIGLDLWRGLGDDLEKRLEAIP